jgi:hypothetical protein
MGEWWSIWEYIENIELEDPVECPEDGAIQYGTRHWFVVWILISK